jgi:tryptophan halogenase
LGVFLINLNKIVIVGGGSAGWMSATTLIKAFPKKDITVIESPDYPIIGVGESTLGGITEWTNWIGLDESDFMPYTDAVYKMSIKFTDFYKKDSGSFHYPFGKPYIGKNFNHMNDWYIKKILNPELETSDFAETFFPVLALVKENKISFNESGKLNNFNFNNDVAYHFDATKFGQWLKNNYCVPRGVKIISSTVKDIKVNEDGIESLTLDNGDLVTADLFIDCTGFKSLLLGDALKEPWNDFEHMLPNNRAWATRVPYTEIEKEMEPFTNCTAIENGWVWNIPSWERIGTGYVYSDKYVSPEDALVEFKNYLKSDKMKIYNPDRDVDSYEYKDIKFRVGIHERTWVKNVVAIGLSAGFIEPLESNGLFTVHEFLMKLVKSLDRGTVTQWNRDAYNMATKEQYLGFKEFVAMHYALTNRDDTQYWKDITNKVFQPKVSALEPYSYRGFNDLASRVITTCRYDEISGINYIATGLNYFPISETNIFNYQQKENINYYDETKEIFEVWEENKKRWQEEADSSPTMYQWLKENIHNDRS